MIEPDQQPITIPTPERFRGETLYAATVPERALLRLLAAAHERDLDAAEPVARLAQEFSDRHATLLSELSESLASGMSAVASLHATPGVLDPSVVLALEFAERDGALLPMYHALVANQAQSAHELRTNESTPGQEMIRSCVGVFFAMLVLTFLMRFVLPTFEKMFDEFGLTLPSLMVSLLALATYVPLMVLVVLLAFLLYLALSFTEIVRSVFYRTSPLTWTRQWIPANVRWLSLLSIASQTRLSLEQAVATLAEMPSAGRLKPKLQKAASRIAGGEEPFAVLRSERLLSASESSALALASPGSARVWLLRWFAVRRWRRSRFWTPFIARAISVVTTLFLSVIVAWTALGVMMALFELISGMS